MRLTFTTAVAIAMLNAGLAQAAETVRIGVEGNYPPFSEVSTDGTLSGFDIDIANALCAKMKVECELVQQEWDGMIPALNAKKFDMIVASMSITDERKKPRRLLGPLLRRALALHRQGRRLHRLHARDAEGQDDRRAAQLRRAPSSWRRPTRTITVLLVDKETEVYLELAAGRGDIAFGSSVVSGESFLKTAGGQGLRARSAKRSS